MDILIHTLSGVAIGTVISGFMRKGAKEKLKVIGFSGLGGAFPDIDAISLWSRFDSTFGRVFNLKDSGSTIYFSKFWYSHHGFFHSIAASIILALSIGFIFYIAQRVFNKKINENLTSSLKLNSPILTGFAAGFIMHLFEDMPTPACVWGGVRLLWPLNIYIGGTGEIWWWNNYDIFIIIVGLIVVNGVILSLNSRSSNQEPKARTDEIKRTAFSGKLTLGVFILAFVLCMIQIKTRGYDFNYTGQTSKFQQYERKSKEVQRKILGKKVYEKMVKFDRKVKVNF